MHAAPSELELVLVGGGHAHLAVLRLLAMAPWPGVRATLITREVHTPYSGMLPGHVAGLYDADAIHVDLGPLAARGGVRLVHDELTGLDPDARRLSFRDRPPVDFDLLSLDTGSIPSLGAIEGDVDRLVPVKPISAFLPRLEALLARLRAASDPLRLAVIGGGPGGVELLLALVHRLRREGLGARVRPVLVTASATVLAASPPRVRRRLARALEAAGVEVHVDARVVAVDGSALVLADGRRLDADEALLVTDAAAPDWAARSGLAVDAAGFVAVGPTLQSTSHERVFAAGDVAQLVHAPRPRSGVYAVRAGPVLADNLERWIRGRTLRAFRPQRRALYLVTTGGAEAVAQRPFLPAFTGHWVWRWKDTIDRRFVARFADLPAMDDAPPASVVAPARGGGRLDPRMRCTGCGSKVDADTLGDALAELAGGEAPGFEDAAPLPVDGPRLVQTVDGFPLPLPDLWLSGRIAALHALGDLHAAGARPRAAMALATLPFAAPHLMRSDLVQLMDGVRRTLDDEGCPLLGGHSCEGPQPALGLSLTGEVPADGGPTKGGGRAGDVLVLTKALGTGAILAGTTDGRLPSRRRLDAIPHLLQSNRAAADVFAAHGVRGCTDVTGFGLLGHALEMADAAGCGLALDVDAGPTLGGALAAIAGGVVSSLQVANEAVLARVRFRGVAPGEARVRMLCDPQTCGGLLAAVPATSLDAVLAELRAAGYDAATAVGRLTDPGAGIVLEGSA
jgi:selenide,water dikinase